MAVSIALVAGDAEGGGLEYGNGEGGGLEDDDGGGGVLKGKDGKGFSAWITAPNLDIGSEFGFRLQILLSVSNMDVASKF